MAYFLTVEKSRGNYIILPINKFMGIGLFIRDKNSRYKQDGYCSLKEIDEFTKNFNDASELREFLVSRGMLSVNLIDKKLAIRYNSNGLFKKVMYDLMYQRDIEYLVNPRLLIREIEYRLIREDYEFLRDLLNHFSHHHRAEAEIAETINYINNLIRFKDVLSYQGKEREYLTRRDRFGNNEVTRIIKKLMYDNNYECLNYRNFHDILAFMNNYDDNRNSCKEQKIVRKYQEDVLDEEYQMSMFQEEVLDEEYQMSMFQEDYPTCDETLVEEDDMDKIIFGAPAVYPSEEYYDGIDKKYIVINNSFSKCKKRTRKINPDQMSLFK